MTAYDPARRRRAFFGLLIASVLGVGAGVGCLALFGPAAAPFLRALSQLGVVGLFIGWAWLDWREAPRTRRWRATLLVAALPVPGLLLEPAIGRVVLDAALIVGGVLWPLALCTLHGRRLGASLRGHWLAMVGHVLGTSFLSIAWVAFGLPALMAADRWGVPYNLLVVLAYFLGQAGLHGFLMARAHRALEEPVRQLSAVFD